MRGGIARVQLDRLREFRDRPLGAACPHGDQAQGKVGIGVARVERDGALRELVSLVVIGVGVLRPTGLSRARQRDRQRRGGLRVLRVDRQRAPEIGLRLDVVRLVLAVMVEHAALVKLVGILAVLRPLGDALALEFEEFGLDRAGDRPDDLVLQFEQVGQVAVVPLGHDVVVGVGADQLRGDPHPMPRFAYAALEHVAGAQLLADLLDVDSLALVGEGRVAGDHREGAPAGEQRDDVLGDAVGEEFLLGIVAEIGERQYRDRPVFVKTRRAHRSGGTEMIRPIGRCPGHAVDVDRPADVLQFFRAEILELELDLVHDLVVDDPRDIDAARLGQRFEPRRDIDAVAENIAALDDDVAEIDADPQGDAPLGRQGLVLLDDRIAQGRRAARCLDDALELAERQIAGLLEQVAAIFADQRLDDFGQHAAQLGDPVGLVAGQQPSVAGDQNGRQPPPDPCSRHIRHGDCAPIARRGNYMTSMILCL